MRIKVRLILITIICFVLAGIPALFICFYTLNNEIVKRNYEIEQKNIERQISSIDSLFTSLISDAAWMSQNESVMRAMSHERDEMTNSDWADLIAAQKVISTYMSASPVTKYLNKLVFFNDSGTMFEMPAIRSGNLNDAELIMLKEEFQNLSFENGVKVRLIASTTLNEPRENSIAAFSIIDMNYGYIYAEINENMFSDILSSESAVEITDKKGWSVKSSSFIDGKDYYETEIPSSSPIKIYYRLYMDKTPFSIFSFYGFTLFIILIFIAVILCYILALVLTRTITRPVNRLISFIRQLSDNDEYGMTSSQIEKGDDEISEIGKSVNEMSLSIRNLLENNKNLYEMQKKAELEMLQMQVNPHFLYNTLESINYLATIQKAPGISHMARGLTNLLRSIAKGNDREISLSEELEIVKNYDDIQQVRYMGMYEIIYSIPSRFLSYSILKFTLQPLIENAIFHGIEPSGHDGKIIIKASENSSYLFIDIIDNGIGMSQHSMEKIQGERGKGTLTGVGIRNVDERLRLFYGNGCGLEIYSEENLYTRIRVKVRKK